MEGTGKMKYHEKILINSESCKSCVLRKICLAKVRYSLMYCTSWKIDDENFRAYQTNAEKILSLLDINNLHDFIANPFDPDRFPWGDTLAKANYDNLGEWLKSPCEGIK